MTAEQTTAGRLRWNEVLRALREARGVTQDGWAARIGVSRATIQRWESGERVPDPGAETGIIAYCADQGLLRAYDRGTLAGLSLTAGSLQTLLEEARLGGNSRQPAAGERGAESRPDQHTPARTDPEAALSARPSALPAPLTSFIGREPEIAALRRVQAGTRLLTLTGAGGCGKTRLAIELAGELLWAHPHGVWLVELAALSDPALVPQAVAAAIGVQTSGQQSLTAALIDFLTPRHVLLILDNCEHLLGACAELVETLLRACPHLEILATSREPLGISGETIWRVPPMALPVVARQWAAGSGQWGTAVGRDAYRERPALPLPDRSAAPAHAPTAHGPLPAALPDAVRLFVERARQYQPDFDLTEANRGAIDEICLRLDGIPLAIELAAARVKVLSPDQIAARLGDRFRLLTGGSRTALPRQQTLQAAMDWSYDLLTESEQALLRKLSVFAGGFTLEAAEVVGRPNPRRIRSDAPFPPREGGAKTRQHNQTQGTPPLVGEGAARSEGDGRPAPAPVDPDVLDLLTQLVDKSLVSADAHPGVVRYRLLETVRQYAAEKLGETGEDEAARGRHVGWYMALAEDAAAELRGPREPGWLAQLEQEHDNLRAALGWSLARREANAALRLAGALARFWVVRGHLHEGRQWLAQALAAGAHAPIAVQAKALQSASVLAYMQGDYAGARGLAEDSLILHRELEHEQGIADAQGSLGYIAFRQGEYAAAHALLEASLTFHTRRGHKPGIASARNALGLLALRRGEHVAARALFEASLALYRELGNRDGVASTLEDLATVAGEQGDTERQTALLAESLAQYQALGSKDGIALVLGNLGMAAWTRGEYDRSVALLEDSLALYREVGDLRGVARLLSNQGFVALYQRDYVRAMRLCRESLALYRELGDMWGVGRYLPVLAGATLGLGQIERAVHLFGAGAALRDRLGTPLPPIVQATHDRTIAVMRERLGDHSFTAAWAEGQAMPAEAAVAYALEDATPSS